MNINALGYLGIRSGQPEQWATFAQEILGMPATTRPDGSVELRMDERAHRIRIEPGEPEGAVYFGWEVRDASSLEDAGRALEAGGLAVKCASDDELQARAVERMIFVEDPSGARVELFCDARDADTPFAPTREISGFVTGEQGMGHVVLVAPDIAPVRSFYVDTLGFRVSDYVRQPLNADFLHVNERHHSLALLEAPVSAMHHFMVELRELDDVGRTYDLVGQRGVGIAGTLGRHTNDLMVSFYVQSPSGFLVEYGWGGRLVDDSWEPVELHQGVSIWGHAGLLG